MILAHSLDGLLRIRTTSTHTAVVELRSHMHPGEWVYCAWKSNPIDDAWELFLTQCIYHTDPKLVDVIQPGV